ncbi:MAG TPA: hypothetical protein VKS81_09435 [Bacteroidota bacterium]|nr:hypothetical protein [Bacteroidota bacterium]
MSEFQISIFFHFLGLGLFFTTLAGGIMLEAQYRRARDIQQRLTIISSLKSIGILSPVAVLIMLASGISNMISRGYGVLTVGWLTAKIILFAIMAISGILFAVKSRKRSKIVHDTATGNAPADAAEQLKSLNGQVSLFYLVMFVLIVLIIGLSVYGVAS